MKRSHSKLFSMFVFMFVLKRATKVNGSPHGKFIKISYSKRFFYDVCFLVCIEKSYEEGQRVTSWEIHQNKLLKAFRRVTRRQVTLLYSLQYHSGMRHFTQAITTTNACQNGSSNLLPLYMEQVVFPRIYREQSVHLSLCVCIELLIFTPGLCKVLTGITKALS